MAEDLALTVLDKLRSLPLSIAKAFANLFALSVKCLFAQQDKMLAS
jgi:hypothetical protein